MSTGSSNRHSRQVSRRRMLHWTGAAAASTLAAPYVLTSTALGAEGRPAASDRIVMGVIGIGGRGNGVMRAFMYKDDVQVVAVLNQPHPCLGGWPEHQHAVARTLRLVRRFLGDHPRNFVQIGGCQRSKAANHHTQTAQQSRMPVHRGSPPFDKSRGRPSNPE